MYLNCSKTLFSFDDVVFLLNIVGLTIIEPLHSVAINSFLKLSVGGIK